MEILVQTRSGKNRSLSDALKVCASAHEGFGD